MGRTFGSLQNYQVDGNKEMIAIGLMNMAGSCSSCYVTTGKYFSFLFFFSFCIMVIRREISKKSIVFFQDHSLDLR